MNAPEQPAVPPPPPVADIWGAALADGSGRHVPVRRHWPELAAALDAEVDAAGSVPDTGQAREVDNDAFGVTCVDCGEAVTDDRPSGETEEGPVHYGCGDDVQAPDVTELRAALQRVADVLDFADGAEDYGTVEIDTDVVRLAMTNVQDENTPTAALRDAVRALLGTDITPDPAPPAVQPAACQTCRGLLLPGPESDTWRHVIIARDADHAGVPVEDNLPADAVRLVPDTVQARDDVRGWLHERIEAGGDPMLARVLAERDALDEARELNAKRAATILRLREDLERVRQDNLRLERQVRLLDGTGQAREPRPVYPQVWCDDSSGPNGIGGTCVLGPGHLHRDGLGGEWPVEPSGDTVRAAVAAAQAPESPTDSTPQAGRGGSSEAETATGAVQAPDVTSRVDTELMLLARAIEKMAGYDNDVQAPWVVERIGLIRALLGTDTTPDRLAWIDTAAETAAAERQARYQETACARRPAEDALAERWPQ